ncbi:hypothetical protein KBB08_03200 [Candidatus Gracilibacteria bacterium]|nr:hypothetical protein [Candidatus Gracilibacteria bacterium]
MKLEALHDDVSLPEALVTNGYELTSDIRGRYLGGRLGVNLVTNSKTGKVSVLKMATEHKPLDSDQVRLLALAQKTDTGRMKLPNLEAAGDGWFLMEPVQGVPLSSVLDIQPQTYLTLSLELANKYQQLLAEYHRTYGRRAISAAERAWVFQRLQDWGAPLVQERLLSPNRLKDIEKEWCKLVARYGDSLYKHVHGNIHGDHVIGNSNHLYVLDAVDWIRPCPFEGAMYDWLRALDWTLVKAKDPQAMFEVALTMIRKKLRTKDPQEVKTFLALRGIGCLGADILQQKDPPPEDNSLARVRVLIQLINGDYKL